MDFLNLKYAFYLGAMVMTAGTLVFILLMFRAIGPLPVKSFSHDRSHYNTEPDIIPLKLLVHAGPVSTAHLIERI